MTSPKQDARNTMKRRQKATWQGREAVERVFEHLEKLDRPTTSLLKRLELWRLIVDAARNAHERELKKLDELNVVMADPRITEVFGGIVG